MNDTNTFNNHLGSVPRTWITQLSGFHCWRFDMIQNCYTVGSSKHILKLMSLLQPVH